MLIMCIYMSLLCGSSCVGRRATAWKMYDVWVQLLEAEACGCGPGSSDVDLCSFPENYSQERHLWTRRTVSSTNEHSYSRTRYCLPSSIARGVTC